MQENYYYIDYENNKAMDFYLLGYGDELHTKQIILDDNLLGLAKNHNMQVSSALEATQVFLENVYKNDGIVVAYSTAEKQYFNYLNKNLLLNKYRNLPYLNLAKAAKKWIRKYHYDTFLKLPPFRKNADMYMKKRMIYSLGSVMRLTSLKAPSDYAPGKTTSRFNTVKKSLIIKKQDYEKLTAVQKAKATKVLKHNTFDVDALRILRKDISSIDKEIIKKCVITCLD
jgi:hypothetical protein